MNSSFEVGSDEALKSICITTVIIVIAVIIAIIFVFCELLHNDPLQSSCCKFSDKISGIVFLLFMVALICMFIPFFIPAGLLLFVLLIPVILYIVVK